MNNNTGLIPIKISRADAIRLNSVFPDNTLIEIYEDPQEFRFGDGVTPFNSLKILSGGGSGVVSSVAGRIGDIVLTKTDVNLSNIDNTSDINKPISIAQATINSSTSQTLTTIQTATNAALPSTTFTNYQSSNNTAVTNNTTLANTALKTANTTFISSYENINGVYNPLLLAAGLDNPSVNATNGLTNHPSGGVVAAVSGTTGQGNLYIPKPIDPTKPFRVAVLVEINDAVPITQIHVGDVGDDYRTGIRIAGLSTSGFAATIGGVNFCVTTTIPIGTKFWITMTSDGTKVTSAIIPYTTSIGLSTSSSSYTWDNRVVYTTTSITNANTSINTFGGEGAQLQYKVNRISITNTSTLNRVIGVYVNQGLGNPSDGKLNPPAILLTSILQDNSAVIFIPGVQGSKLTDLVMVNHQNAYGNLSNCNVGQAAAPTIMNLWASGYLTFGIDGCYLAPAVSFTEATTSNWGAPTGMKYRKSLLEYVRTNIPMTRNLNLLGFSMGFFNSLRWIIQFPNTVKSLYGVGGVCDLTDSYTNRGFATTIQKAWGDFYQGVTANTGIDPGQVVTINGTQTIGVTSIPVLALTAAIPSGTTLTFSTGTATQTTLVLTAAATINATSITVTTTTGTINTGAKYNMSFHWQKLTYGFGQVEDLYYPAPYIWRDTYIAATAYNINDIVTKPSIGTIKTFAFADPNLNAQAFNKLPITISEGDADTTIPPIQSQNFKTNVESFGGSVQIITVPGGTHLSPSTFDPTGIVTFFNTNNT